MENMQTNLKEKYLNQFDTIIEASYMCYKDGDNEDTYEDASSFFGYSDSSNDSNNSDDDSE